MARGSRLSALAVLATVIAGTTACQPPPPRLALTVTTTAAGPDSTLGDGICASSTAGGACTLEAALDEGNTAPHGADLTVPTGNYDIAYVTITGDINVNHASTERIHVNGVLWAVAARGRLILNGVDSDSPTKGLRLGVYGKAVINRSFIAGGFDVQAGGVLIASSSIAGGRGGAYGDNVNRGTVLTTASSLLGIFDTPIGLTTGIGAKSYLQSTAIVHPDIWYGGSLFRAGGAGTCQGDPVASNGYVHVEIACPITADQGDQIGDADARVVADTNFVAETLLLTPGSPLIDAIPLDDPACDTSDTDLYGTQRGIDGNGDGIGGCDIGAVEYQPPLAN